MKLAILGSSPIALEAALEFHFHGAAVTWFNASEIEPESFLDLDYSKYTSDQGKQVLKEMNVNLPSKISWQAWKEFYFTSIEQFLKIHQEVKPHQMISVTKRYLAPFEQIENKSRFLDLFRLTYLVNPENFIQEQKQNNPETFERLNTEMVESLQSTLEMYEDFDLVMDFRRSTFPGSIAITGRAMGETRVSQDKVFYGFNALANSKKIKLEDNIRELALVGSGLLAGEILLQLSEWLKDPRTRLFIISTEANPFDKILESAIPEKSKALRNVFDYMEAEFEKEINEFHTKLREWQALDDFIQAKKPKPAEPIPRLVFFSGHNVTAMDQLIDKNRLFITLEKPDWRPGLKHAENNAIDLKTIGVDQVFVASKLRKPSLIKFLDENEKGFYIMEPNLPLKKNGFADDLLKLKGITNEIFKLFSPADPH